MFNVFYAAIKPFLKEEFINKLHWHKPPFKTLQKFQDPSLIPKNLGGSLDIEEVKNWHEVILNKEHIFKEHLTMGYIKH
uniref:CRAL-TRIO domain-containing protein n=2 Tax=Rhodnius prolixus TaxID=13249 RepID=T1HXU6_RHOPR